MQIGSIDERVPAAIRTRLLTVYPGCLPSRACLLTVFRLFAVYLLCKCICWSHLFLLAILCAYCPLSTWSLVTSMFVACYFCSFIVIFLACRAVRVTYVNAFKFSLATAPARWTCSPDDFLFAFLTCL